MAWYEESFGREYLKLYANRNLAEARANIQDIINLLALQNDAPLLDLCCGAGRHLLILYEMGFRQLVGLDLSDELLRVAARELAAENNLPHPPFSLIRGDMRAIPSKNHFAAILSLFTSFGYFEADEENQAVLTTVHNALRPGGVFLMDYVNRDYLISHLVAEDEKLLAGGHILNVRQITDDCRRVEKTTTFSCQGTEHRFHESVRLYSPAEMIERYQIAGFTNIRYYGSVSGQRFSPESKRLILIGEKRKNDD